MSTLVQDVRYGLRMLLRSPGLTAAAALTLALGIGANTAIFTVVNTIVLRPLPYPEADRLLKVYQVWDQAPADHDVLSAGDVAILREKESALGGVAAYYSPAGGFALTGSGDPEQVRGTSVTANLLDVLGTRPALGRGLASEDERPGAAPVVVLSHALWQRRFGGDKAIVGKTIGVNDRTSTIVGVMPKEFRFPRDQVADLWVVFRPERSENRPPYYIHALARPRPDANPAAVQAALQAATSEIQQQFSNDTSDWHLAAGPLKEELVGTVRPALLVLLGAVSLVLLIATANIANLLLARATTRRKEMAIRAALGAGRVRLVRQLVTESLLLAGTGGLLGILVSLWGTDLLVRIGPRNLPRLYEVGIDGRVLFYTAFVSVASGFLFGLAPALQASRTGLAPALHDGARGTTDRSGRRLRNSLVVAEFALAVVLLGGAGLLIRSFQRLQSVSPGFEAEGLLTASISLPEARYPDGPARSAFFRRLVERAGSLPGVRGAAISMALPPNLSVMSNPYTVEGSTRPEGQSAPVAGHLLISPGYFRTLGVPLLRGREFTDADIEGAPGVLIIDQAMASMVFGREDPIGKHLRLGGSGPEVPWTTIVGVVGDVKYTGLDAAEPTMYTPYEQNLWWPTMYLVLRSTVKPDSLAPALRAKVVEMDPLLPVARVRSMRELLGQSVAEPRFRTLLLGMFAGLALLLAAAGIYGILSYTVGQRTQEIGIRMALGARRTDVLTLVMRQGMALACSGVGLGLLASLPLGRLLAGLLFGVAPTDATTFAAVSIVMVAAAFLACYVPARRATRVDPMVALRAE